MDELMIVANVAIIFGVMYKLFELYAKRKERIMLIEKLPPELLDKEKVKYPNSSSPSGFFSALRMGCLFLGIGLSLIAGYCIVYNTQPAYFSNYSYHVNETVSLIYGASVLIGGGIGLIVAFLVELKLNKKNEE